MRSIYIEKHTEVTVCVEPLEIIDEMTREDLAKLANVIAKKLSKLDTDPRYGNTLQETLITEELLELKQKLNIHELSELNQKIDSVKPLLS